MGKPSLTAFMVHYFIAGPDSKGRTSPGSRRRSVRVRHTIAFVLAAVSVIGVVGAVLLLPTYIVERRQLPVEFTTRLEAESDLRSALVQLLGGFVLLGGFYFTARGFRLNRESHITERYAKAIDQIGSPNADVRVGGIYALERIAKDSPGDRAAIVDVLTTFVREHTRSGPRQPSDDPVEADVQAALLVVGRRPETGEEAPRLNLYHSGLTNAECHGADFRHAMLYYSVLEGASFAGADLEDAGLSFCRAERAAFTRARARGANFVNAVYVRCWFLDADLRDADFQGADLSGSDFGRRYAEQGDPPMPPANVAGANFTKARLKGTNFCGVDLRTVTGLSPAQLAEAIVDQQTLPPKWDADGAEPGG